MRSANTFLELILLRVPSLGVREVIRHVQFPLRKKTAVLFLTPASAFSSPKSSPLMPFRNLLLPFQALPRLTLCGHSPSGKQGGEGGRGHRGFSATWGCGLHRPFLTCLLHSSPHGAWILGRDGSAGLTLVSWMSKRENKAFSTILNFLTFSVGMTGGGPWQGGEV